jgi:hypothetical protein
MSVVDSDLRDYGACLSESDGELIWRNAVGRSYYAAYHRADTWHEALPSHGVAKPGQGAHATLIDCLQHPTVTGPTSMRSRAVGYVLAHMKAFRTKADYELHLDVDQAEARTAVEYASKVFAKT